MSIQSEKYAEMGQQIVNELFPELQNVQIAWLESMKEKKSNGRIIFADCTKVSDLYSWCCPYDFMITIYEPNIVDFTDEQIRILLEHEIMHIGVDKDKWYVKPHDFEEFYSIVEKYGLNWSRTGSVDYALLDD